MPGPGAYDSLIKKFGKTGRKFEMKGKGHNILGKLELSDFIFT